MRRLALSVLTVLVVASAGCSRVPFEDEAHGAVPPQPTREPEPASAAADAGSLLPYAVVGRSVAGRFDLPGAGIRARFRDALTLTLDAVGHDELAVLIDEREEVRSLRPGENVVRVEAPGEHVALVVKRTEARDGHFVLRQVEGALPIAPRRRVEFLGDSITAGFGIDAPATGPCTFVPREQNAAHTYAVRLAEARGLDASLVAASSKTTREMSALFELAWPEAGAPVWGFEERPAAVVVLLGTNDFFQREPDRRTFVYDTRDMLGRVRAHYGDEVPVVLALSPMLSDSYPAGARHRTLARKYMQNALDAARAAGDQHLHWVELDEPTHDEGHGCSSHPSAATHARMAKTLGALFDEAKL